MAVIDKNMYEKLKKWCDYDEGVRPQNQYIMYVNSHDRELTSATIRKLMFEMCEEDEHGELYMSFYSAQNFYRNMRDYYLEIARLYLSKPSEDAELLGVIRNYPPTCGWIALVVEGIETFFDDCGKMQELMEKLMAFAARRPSIILIGNGDYRDVFYKCDYALHSMEAGFAAKEEDNMLMIGSYNQEENPCRESVVYANPKKQCAELAFYWDTMYEQLEKGYFDYEDYKTLFKDTMEYIIPRVSKEKVYRNDLFLIENISAFKDKTFDKIDGCMPWEIKAAEKFATGFHKAIVNLFGYNDDFSKERIGIEMWIEDRPEVHGGVHFSGEFSLTRLVCAENVCHNMDKVATCIHMSTFEGKEFEAWKYMQDEDEEVAW